MADNIVPEQPITTFSKEKWFGGLRKDQDGKWNLDDGTDAETEKD